LVPTSKTLTIRGVGSSDSIPPGSGTIIKTTTPAVILMGAVSSAYANPVYNLSGFSLLGPDGSCATTTSGDGLKMTGTAQPVVSMADISAYSFCGAGAAGFNLADVEYGVFSRMAAVYSDTGWRLSNAFNANTLTSVTASLNASYGIDIQDCQNNVFDAAAVQSNQKTGMRITAPASGSNGNVFHAGHFENNNTSATAGVFAFELTATPGHYVNNNKCAACVFQGARENVGLNGVSNAGSINNTFEGGLASSAANPFVISNGSNGSAIFDGLTSRSSVTDPSFVMTILNDTSDGHDYYPDHYRGNSYTKGTRTYSAVSPSIGGTALAAGGCTSGTVSFAGIAPNDGILVSPNSPGQDANFYWFGYYAGNAVTVSVCAIAAGTPGATTYNVRVFHDY
jgi:hypothetical protein